MKPTASKTYPDFNPALRHPADFGYSSFKDAVHSVFQAFGLTAPLAYPRALDTSHWTCENIQDWQAVAKTIVLQYNKSTEGFSFTDIDSQLATLEGKMAGLISLFYHFFRRNLNGTSQWNYFKDKTENPILQIGGAKLVIIDMETPDGVPNSTGNLNFKLFCNSAHADGYKVGLYVNPAQWVSFGLGSWVNEFIDFYIIAHWQAGNNPDQPAGIDPAKIAMQQEGVLGLHSWIQPIPGLVPQMDANLLLWPLAQWETFTGQKYTPGGIEPPPPDPEPIGEPTLKFITKFVLNVRSGADTTFPIVGSLPVNTVVSALQIQPTDSNSVWLEFETGKWVAMVHNGGGPYLSFHSATEGEPIPMTPEQLARLETVESLTAEHTADILTLQQSQVDVFEATHKLVTTKPGGEKLRAWPGGSEAVQIYNNALLMDLEQTRGGQKLMAFVQEGVIITGFVDPVVLLEL